MLPTFIFDFIMNSLPRILFLFATWSLLHTGLAGWAQQKPAIEYIDGRPYILHTVQPGETLYSIARQYKASMNAIAEATPEVRRGLKDGMVIRIPYKAPPKPPEAVTRHQVQKGETLYSISRQYGVTVAQLRSWNHLTGNELRVGQVLQIGGEDAPAPTGYSRDGRQIHIVQAGEGLYAIARQYGVKVDSLMAWNHLTDPALQLGQELIVGPATASPRPVAEPVAGKAGRRLPVAARQRAGKTIGVHNPRAALQRESGLAAPIAGTADDGSYLALHRHLPPGSIVAVRNEMNDQVVFVRVVGKLPPTGVNERLIIRLSAAAVRQLGAIDERFRVELEYLPATGSR